MSSSKYLLPAIVDVHQLIALAFGDHVFDGLQIVLPGAHAKVDVDVVIALALKVILQVALAFH